MKAITLRDIPPKLAKRIRSRAKAEKLSLNKTVIKMLGETAEPPPGKIGNRLDEFFGTWTAEEADAFDRHLAEIRTIDPEMWK